jgi:hypothetical protein
LINRRDATPLASARVQDILPNHRSIGFGPQARSPQSRYSQRAQCVLLKRRQFLTAAGTGAVLVAIAKPAIAQPCCDH